VFYTKLRRAIMLAAAVLIAAVVALGILNAWREYDAAIRAADKRVENLAHVLAEHMRLTVAAIDSVLVQVASAGTQFGGAAGNAREWNVVLEHARAGLTGVNSLSVQDAGGVIRYSTLASAVGRAMGDRYLNRALARGARGLVADEPYRSIAFDEMVIPLARPLPRGDGPYRGAVVATLRLAALRPFYKSLDLGARGLVRIVHPSGPVLFVHPELAGIVGNVIPGDRVHAAYVAGRWDGLVDETFGSSGELITAYRTLAQPAMIIAVSLDRNEVLTNWRSRTLWNSLVLAAVVVAIVASAVLLLRLLRAREILFAEQRRREEERAASAQLLRQANEALEQRVHDRTRALEQEVGERTEAERNLKNALATLQQAQDELVRTEKLAYLGGLVAGVAHELNTPIGNALLVATSLAEKTRDFQARSKEGTLLKSDLARFTSDVAESGELLAGNLTRAAGLIRSFKQVAVDQASEQRRRFELREMLDEVVRTLTPMLRQSPHALALDIEPGIEMDSFPGPLGQIVNNLVANAMLHAFDAGVAGHMYLTARRHGADRVHLVFSDDGHGIPSEHVGRVFDPFFTTLRGKGGSGLGLHIVYNIATRLLGGSVAVESAPGGGTRFTFEIPCVAPGSAGVA